MSTRPTRSIYLFKVISGEKIRWKIEIDLDMVIVSEGPAEFQGPKPQTTVITPAEAKAKRDSIDAYRAVLDERGIKYSISESGQVLVESVPMVEKIIMQFFDLNQECPEKEGMAAIRAQYKNEYETLGGSACPACQLNTLQRKYREILKARVFTNDKP